MFNRSDYGRETQKRPNKKEEKDTSFSHRQTSTRQTQASIIIYTPIKHQHSIDER
jgi:hypothetical protein